MKHAIVAVEDRRFWEHRGVDLRGIGRAVWADVQSKELVQGGSTITQQFVKNTLDRDDRTISRKLKEAALAWQLERKWSKDRILTAYLNTVFFGNGAYGVQMAVARLLQQEGARADPRRGRTSRRDSGEPEPLQPGRQPEDHARAALDRAPPHVRAEDDHRGRALGRRSRAAAEARGRAPARERRAGRLLRRVREAAAHRHVRAGRGVRRRAQGDDLDRPRAPGSRAPHRRRGARREGQAVRGARRHRPARRPRARHVRRAELQGEPVQPGRPGRAPAGLLVQAVRARRRAPRGDLPADDLRVRAAAHQHGRQALVGAQLRGLLPRAHQPLRRDHALRQRGLRAADGARRAEEGRADGAPARDHEPARRVLRHRARRRGREPARDGPRLLHLRQRGEAGRRPHRRQPAARRHQRASATGRPRRTRPSRTR